MLDRFLFGSNQLGQSIQRTPSTTRKDPGNNFKNAYNLRNLGGKTRRFKEFVGFSDSVDNYRFTLSDPRDVFISLNGLSEYANVNLIYDDGTADGHREGWDGDSRQATISRTLGKGTYFVNVNTNENTNYDLTMSAQ